MYSYYKSNYHHKRQPPQQHKKKETEHNQHGYLPLRKFASLSNLMSYHGESKSDPFLAY